MGALVPATLRPATAGEGPVPREGGGDIKGREVVATPESGVPAVGSTLASAVGAVRTGGAVLGAPDRDVVGALLAVGPLVA